MLISLLHLIRWIAVAATAASIAYCMIAMLASLRFALRKARAIQWSDLPVVSILKPLKGADPQMYEALRSHCEQDYPEYELLCGVTNPGDPAVPVVEKLMREFPHRKIRLVLCDKRLGANGKVSSLIQLAHEARAEFFLVNDSDIRVEPDYLKTVIGELQHPDTGLVTCLYRGIGGESLGSRLEALGINTDFVPGILSAEVLEGGIRFGLGSTLALRKSDLKAVGGFDAIVDYLADDYELGSRIAQLGKKIQLSRTVVETNLPIYDFVGFWAHQQRWARTIRASRPGGYLGLLFTFTIPWGLALIATGYSQPWAWELVAAAFVARFSLALWTSRKVLSEKAAAPMLLLPIRDVLAVAVWVGGWFGNSILWRGGRFRLQKGKLVPRIDGGRKT